MQEKRWYRTSCFPHVQHLNSLSYITAMLLPEAAAREPLITNLTQIILRLK